MRDENCFYVFVNMVGNKLFLSIFAVAYLEKWKVKLKIEKIINHKYCFIKKECSHTP